MKKTALILSVVFLLSGSLLAKLAVAQVANTYDGTIRVATSDDLKGKIVPPIESPETTYVEVKQTEYQFTISQIDQQIQAMTNQLRSIQNTIDMLKGKKEKALAVGK